MKSLVSIQIIVLIGLLFAATLCLTSHISIAFSELDVPDLYLPTIKTLEGSPPFEGKEALVTVLNSLVAAQSSGLKALRANAEQKEALGYLLLVLSVIQGAGVFVLVRNMRRETK